MPISEDQLSRELVALKDIFAEFRSEMRITLSGFVRNDVYQAQQETMRASLAAQETFYKAKMDALQVEITRLNTRLDDVNNDKRQNKGIAWGAIGSAAVALFVSLFKFH